MLPACNYLKWAQSNRLLCTKAWAQKIQNFGARSAGGDIERAYYSIEFDSHEAYGKFNDAMLASEWWAATIEWMIANKDEIENLGTALYYDAL